MDNIIALAHEAQFEGFGNGDWVCTTEEIARFAALVRADEAEKYKWDVHSCGPTCTRHACVATRKAVQAEREACAKVCRSEADRALWNFQNDLPQNESFWNGAEQMASSCENLIKARGNA